MLQCQKARGNNQSRRGAIGPRRHASENASDATEKGPEAEGRRHPQATARLSAKARSITPLPVVARRRPLILPTRAAPASSMGSPSLDRGGATKEGRSEGSRGVEPLQEGTMEEEGEEQEMGSRHHYGIGSTEARIEQNPLTKR
ncbi:hypothetical protein BHM03_00029051 [Ensete ventricosum]|nr:hypothetical protein BHM03_00029051 [Ensete ventricosum]